MTRIVTTLSLIIFLVSKSLCTGIVINNGLINHSYKNLIDKNEPIYIEYPTRNSEPYRISVTSNANSQYPVHVVVRQEKYVTSWTVPLSVESFDGGFTELQNTARTLCWDEYLHHSTRLIPIPTVGSKTNFTVSISTYSEAKVSVTVRATIVSEYFIHPNVNTTVHFSPSQPVFYYFSFNNVPLDIKTIFVNINAKQKSCFTVSIQEKRCPIYDLNDDIDYKGLHVSLATKGGITVTRRRFPKGFVIVLVSHTDDEKCLTKHTFSKSAPQINYNQITEASFLVEIGEGRRTYYIGIFVLLGFNLLFLLVVTILSILFYKFGNYKGSNVKYADTRSDSDRVDLIDGLHGKEDHTLADFVRKKERIEKKSLNYFSHICNIGIFYGLPVVQLMVSYQMTVLDSGDLDLCYYNTFCSHPLFFTDFNHIYSNLGYMMFGAFFLAIVYFRHKYYVNKPECGVPRHYGHYYAMGVALIFEGVLSACYHICPNQHNFQFDTSFMYVMAMLLTVKLYQNRHCDYDASVYGFCFILGFLVFVALIGILTNSHVVMILFVAAYLMFLFLMSFKLYFFADVVRRFKEIFEDDNRASLGKMLRPIRPKQFVLILVANLINLVTAVGGIFLYPKYVDFGTFILAILMMNLILYALFYTAMKMIKGERIGWEPILYGVISLVAWFGGAYFFMSSVTEWSLSPAQSRGLNSDCIILSFYDSHDIWHVISSLALFTSFMFMISLDDDLGEKPYDQIDVF